MLFRSRRRPPPQYAYNQAYGPNHQTSNEPLGKTPQEAGEAAEGTVEETVEEAATAAEGEGTLIVN